MWVATSFQQTRPHFFDTRHLQKMLQALGVYWPSPSTHHNPLWSHAGWLHWQSPESDSPWYQRQDVACAFGFLVTIKPTVFTEPPRFNTLWIDQPISPVKFLPFFFDTVDLTDPTRSPKHHVDSIGCSDHKRFKGGNSLGSRRHCVPILENRSRWRSHAWCVLNLYPLSLINWTKLCLISSLSSSETSLSFTIISQYTTS